MSKLAIIPARGGSKRIPMKNIKNFSGKPIIAYSIEAALSSNLFDEVMVSTDNFEIAEIAKQYGATVPFFRSEENSNDFAGTVDVLLEVMQHYESQNRTFETACCIYPTAPFATPSLLVEGYNLLESQNYSTVFPVVEFNNPIQRSLKIIENGKVEMVWPEFLTSRSQDLPKRYHDSGLFYWFRPDNLKVERKLFCDNSGVLIISNLASHDIDSVEDWEIAELKYRRLMSLNK